MDVFIVQTFDRLLFKKVMSHLLNARQLFSNVCNDLRPVLKNEPAFQSWTALSNHIRRLSFPAADIDQYNRIITLDQATQFTFKWVDANGRKTGLRLGLHGVIESLCSLGVLGNVFPHGLALGIMCECVRVVGQGGGILETVFSEELVESDHWKEIFVHPAALQAGLVFR